MKILVVSNMYPSKENPGYGVFVKNFEVGLQACGAFLDRSVIVGRAPGKLNKILSYLIFFARTSWFIVSRRYDCVYVHYVAHSFLPVIPFLPLLKLRKTVLVCNAHGEDLLPRSFSERVIFFIVRKFIGCSSLVVVPSPFFYDIAQSSWPGVELFVSASGGVDLTRFKPARNSSRTSGFRIGYVSRIDAGKGWVVLLEAIFKLRMQLPGVKFQVELVGEGRQVEQLVNSIENLCLQDCVYYLGALPQSELPDFFSSIDVFVFPTELQESLGLVGLEAMACSIPVICSDIGGMRGYMRDGFNGFLFPAGDSDALAQRLRFFSELSEGDVSDLKLGAISTAKNYGQEVVSSKLYRKISEVVGR